ncbi:MAG: hypothetical protein IPP19_05595 [Verrucomicrobia bacterium]|nr:hypothetical protein [Verrucomicrobiota bacterium]
MDSQEEFFLGETSGGEASAVASDIRDEIAQVWGLPLGCVVTLSVRGQERIELRGRLELLAAPGFPWDRNQRLRLKLAGVIFFSTEIERWLVV